MFTSNLLDSYSKNTATVTSEQLAMVNMFQELYFVIEGFCFTFSVLAMCPLLFQFHTFLFLYWLDLLTASRKSDVIRRVCMFAVCG